MEIKMKKISIMVPCYNEESVLESFYNEISKVASEMKNVKFEFLFIDDGSKDETLNIIKKFKSFDSRVSYISFSKNFGKEAAMNTGFYLYPVAGWASTICVIIFIGGIQLFCLGIMGQYIAKTYMETKKRPHFIIAESNRNDIKHIG